MLDQQHQQQEVPAGVGSRPQSASYSSSLPGGLLHQPTGAQPAASPHRHMLAGAAPHETLPEAAQKLSPILSAAHQEGLRDLPLAAAPDSDDADGGGLPARPASAFAPVAEEAPPSKWQAGAQATEPQAQTGPEPVGAPLQVRLHLLLHICMSASLAFPSSLCTRKLRGLSMTFCSQCAAVTFHAVSAMLAVLSSKRATTLSMLC